MRKAHSATVRRSYSGVERSLAFSGEVHFTFAESTLQDGSLHYALLQAAVDSPIEVTRLEGRLGDDARFFAALLELLPDTVPPSDDPTWMSLREAVRREIGQIPELSHLLGHTGSS